MAASAVGQIPYAASRSASDYDAAQNDLVRRKRMADQLMQQALTADAPLTTPGAKMSWLSPVAKALAGGLSGYMGTQAADAERENAKQRQADMVSWLNNFPTGNAAQDAVSGTPDIPALAAGTPIAQEGAPATPPPSLAEKFMQANATPAPALTNAPQNAQSAFGPTPSTGSRFLPPPIDASQFAPATSAPMPSFLPKPLALPAPGAALPEGMSPHILATASDAVPGVKARAAVPATPPTPQEIMAWSAGGMPLGPAAQKISETASADALKSMLPRDPLMVVGSDLYDRSSGKFVQSPTTKTRLDEQRIANIERNTNAGLNREAAEVRADADRAMRKQMADDRNALVRAMHASTGAVPGTYKPDSVDENTGRTVLFNSKTGGRYTLNPETNKPEPYTGGSTIPIATHEKNVTNAMAAENEAVMADKAADLIEANPGAYSKTARIGTALGAPTPFLGMNDEEQQARAYVGRDFAETTKRLYGAAFSASEQKRANSFTITALDDANSAMNKAREAAVFAREMAGKHGTAAALTAAQRMSGGGTTPPAAPAAPAGGARPTVNAPAKPRKGASADELLNYFGK